MNKKTIGTNETTNKKTVSGSTLKIIAIVTMFIDHSAAVLFNNFFISKGFDLGTLTDSMYTQFLDQYAGLYYLFLFMRLVGRIAFPIFIFLLIEGAIHTKSKIKYALRLTFFAIISEIPFDLAFNHDLFYFDYQNVFFTLAIGMFMIIGFDLVEKDKLPKIVVGILSFLGIYAPTILILWFYGENLVNTLHGFQIFMDLTTKALYIILSLIILFLTILYLFFKNRKNDFGSMQKTAIHFLTLSLAIAFVTLLKTDYSAMGILAIAIMYRLRTLKTQSFLFGCLVLIIFSPFEISALLGLIPINKYNGNRGLKIKYFFYIFYPAHLFILFLISYLVFGF